MGWFSQDSKSSASISDRNLIIRMNSDAKTRCRCRVRSFVHSISYGPRRLVSAIRHVQLLEGLNSPILSDPFVKCWFEVEGRSASKTFRLLRSANLSSFVDVCLTCRSFAIGFSKRTSKLFRRNTSHTSETRFRFMATALRTGIAPVVVITTLRPMRSEQQWALTGCLIERSKKLFLLPSRSLSAEP